MTEILAYQKLPQFLQKWRWLERRRTIMEPTYYTVIRIDGDYAVLLSDEGIENLVALALLPIEIEEGSRLICEMFSYRLLK
jgi:hypothetical protein